MAANVHLEFKNGDRYKLKFTHSVVSEAVETTGKSVGELLNDRFHGWRHLLRAGLRQQQPRITVEQASQIIDRLLEEGDIDIIGIGDKLVDGLVAAGFIKFKVDEAAEKNGQSPDPPQT
jgi:hypothetical protein